MLKTLRMLFPQWQGGENINYAFGAKILNFISPEDPDSKTVEVPIQYQITANKGEEEYFEKEALIKQQLKAKEILKQENPEKVLIYGGDCSVSQAPFDYLHEKYPENTAVLWIDAHPDITTPKEFSHEHAMVLGNLLGDGAKEMAELVEHYFAPEDVLYIGLKNEEMHDFEKEYLEKNKLSYLSDKDIVEDSSKIVHWLKERNIKQVIVHLDVDVLDPSDFKSQLSNEPGLGPVSYALGTLKLEKVFECLSEIQEYSEIVGLTIAEFIPWDLVRLSREMKKLNIFTN